MEIALNYWSGRLHLSHQMVAIMIDEKIKKDLENFIFEMRKKRGM